MSGRGGRDGGRGRGRGGRSGGGGRGGGFPVGDRSGGPSPSFEGGRGGSAPSGGRGNPTDRKAGRRSAQMAKVNAKGAAEAEFYFKLRASEMRVSAKPQSRDTITRDRDELFDKSHGSSGIRFDEYEEVPVQRSGGGSLDNGGPPALTSFTDLNSTALNVPQFLLENIKRCGYNRPTPIQAHCVPLALDNKNNDLMSCAQTGSGKTCAFLLPVIARLDLYASRGGVVPGAAPVPATAAASPNFAYAAKPAVVVMAPTRELAIQIHHEARRLVFDDDVTKTPPRAVVVYGGADAKGQLRELARGVDILVATPGRLQDFVDRGVVSFSQTKHLILDEADRMLDMGFEPQIRKLVLQRDMPAKHNRQTLMFSATFPQSIQNLAKEFLRGGYTWVGVGRVGSTVNAITQNFELATNDKNHKLGLLMLALEKTPPPQLTLVFTQKKSTASWVANQLTRKHGINAESIHGDRSQSQREGALAAFKTGRAPILVATDVAARGIGTALGLGTQIPPPRLPTLVLRREHYLC
jgi:ATP-dependent RNA helicase DDX3X